MSEAASRINTVESDVMRRQSALLRTSALQNAILNSDNFSIIATDVNGIIQLFNGGAERMLGYTAGEVVNRVSPSDMHDPEEVTARADALSRELATTVAPGFGALAFKASRGIADIYELTYIRKDGSRIPAIVSITALRDEYGEIIGYLLIGTDNSARLAAEEKLRWTEESFRLMVESVTDCAIIMLDPDGRVVSWNSGAQRIKGYSADEIVGQHFSRFYPDGDVASGTTQLRLAATVDKGRFEDEGWRMRKDGSVFWANVVLTAIRDQAGTLRGFAKLTRDLTGRRQIEAAMSDAKSVAEKANLAKSDFLSGMSHELRTPLNAILGFAQIIESGSPPPTPSQKRDIDQILKAGWYLLDLINEILDLSLIESGKATLSREPVSLAEVLLECHTMVEPQARKRGIAMTFPRFEIPHFVLADRTRLKQVLINLLYNAIKYNRPEGAVAVECAPSASGLIRISVQDTGAGLTPEQLRHLFQPFNRLGKEGSSEEGTGIGLVVTKRLVELMEGAIGVGSTVGEGSVFWIELRPTQAPVLQVPEPLTPAPARPPAPQGAPQGAPQRTVLYVEDNPANLELVGQLIARRADLRMLSAVDGRLAVEFARAYRPEVILMDINLPGISGIEAMTILRADPLTAHIPIIALSANAMPRDIERGLKAGFFNYITKPIKVSQFMDALDVALIFAQTAPAQAAKREQA